ncbi:OTU domain-containing protein 6B [Xylaria arbuscula]|nr:OTU domain-containing protein 6B [Xylaria arbuscula]
METLEAIQARHRKEQRDLQSRITSKKKNASKKTRKGVNDECAALEQDLKERQALELGALNGEGGVDERDEGEGEEPNGVGQETNTNSTESRSDTASDTNHITDRLKEKTVSFDIPASKQSSQPPSSDPAAQTHTEQGGGKKRNRQKDRLARRAAEREMEAEAAEQEAQGMTDHRGLERSSLERTFNTHGLVEHEIRPDGHCLFSAVADQLAQRKIPISGSEGTGRDDEAPPYRVVRRVATAYMEHNPDGFAPFLEEPLESYVPKIRDTAEWGGQLELLALASAYRVEIKVVQSGRTETIEPSGGLGGDEGAEKSVDRTIWLAYYRHGYGLGEHYNSLRKKS